MEQKVKLLIGELYLQLYAAQEQLEAAQRRIKELEEAKQAEQQPQ